MYPFLRRLRNTFDYAEYGGAPLLGINGVCMICHGESSAKAIISALIVARDMVSFQVNRKIEAILTAGKNGDKTAIDYDMNGVSLSKSD
jgi:glycerol-3-phosphate acyltransferase PlsX